MNTTCPKCSSLLICEGSRLTCERFVWQHEDGEKCDYQEIRKDYRIRDERLQSFKDAMAKLARRAKRIGCPAPSYTMGEPDDVPELEPVRKDGVVVRDANGKPVMRETGVVFRFWPVTISGESPRFQGWTFVATIQHLETDDGAQQNILRTVPSFEGSIPEEYRSRGPMCDHCGIRRRRNDTYICQHDSGEFKQIGSSCIKDFLGHASPEGLAAAAEYLIDACEAGEEGSCGGGGMQKRFTLRLYLTHVSAIMREDGWISRKEAEARCKSSTATAAYVNMDPPLAYNGVIAEPTEADEARADAAIDWAREISIGDNDYLHNLNVVARCSVLPDRSMGIAASMIQAYERAMGQERERARARAVSKHVGAIGERIIRSAEIITIREIAGMYGTTYLHVMQDTEGNVLKWFGNSTLGDPGATVTFKGTIKDHGDYNGVAETLFSRCAIATEADIAKANKPKRMRKVKEEA